MNKEDSPKNQSRRRFLGHVGGATAASVAAGAAGLPALSLLGAPAAHAAEVGPMKPAQRANKAYEFRLKAALNEKTQPLPAHPTNGDDEAYPNLIASYSKALPHNALGEVNPAAYHALVRAMSSGEPSDFDAIPSGGAVKQTHPQSAFCFELDGADSHHLATPPPPAFSTEHEAAEMCELYWQALTRDVPFSQYGSDPSIKQAVEDLRQFPKFKNVSADNIFRGETPGDLAGPYVSQFLLKPYNFGAQTINQQFRTAVAGNDFMTAYAEWLNIQNGKPAVFGNTFDLTPRYLRNGRDLCEWDHRDFTYQGFLVAALILLGFGPGAVDDANPYKTSANQIGFTCFGAPHILDLVARAANLALKAAWYQKWSVHRRLRPEEFGGRVHNHKTGAASYPVHPKILGSKALVEVFSRYGTYLLPMAYPEGAPTHPAYPSGHAAIAGACTTVLKAFFKESFQIPGPVQVTDNGLVLIPYAGKLTVGDELNKLAANVAIGRNTAGVHWRTDATEGIRLGEAVGLSLMRGYKNSYTENFAGFSLRKFDGTTATI